MTNDHLATPHTHTLKLGGAHGRTRPRGARLDGRAEGRRPRRARLRLLDCDGPRLRRARQSIRFLLARADRKTRSNLIPSDPSAAIECPPCYLSPPRPRTSAREAQAPMLSPRGRPRRCARHQNIDWGPRPSIFKNKQNKNNQTPVEAEAVAAVAAAECTCRSCRSCCSCRS